MTDHAPTTRLGGQRQNVKKYGLALFDSIPQALAGREGILRLCESNAQVNVVIRAEGIAQEALILAIHSKIRVFCGSAWYLIHERRKADGWYESEQE